MQAHLRTHWQLYMLLGVMVVLALVGVPHADAAIDRSSPGGAIALAGLAGVTARAPTIAPFPTDPALTAIAISYRNESLIADSVLPRVPVGRREFRYMKFAKGDRFTLPDTRVGRRSRPNMTEYGATEDVGSCNWAVLDAAIPNEDIAQAPEGYNPINQHVMINRELVALGREKRTADIVFNTNTYAASNKTTLAGTSRWSQAASTPIQDIEAAKDSMIMRPNIGVFGRATWRYLRTNPQIVKALNRNDGDAGIAMKQAVAELFELDEIYVGEGWLNTAKPGQAVNMVRVWGAHAALLHINKNANTQGGTTFGFTAQYGTALGGQWEDKDIGAEGGIRARTGECVGETVAAADLGFLFINAGDNS